MTTPVGTGADCISAVAIQSDGKIIIAGGHSFNGNNMNFALVRYNADGSLDPSFGLSSKATTTIGTGDEYITAVAIQTDGKIVAAGFPSSGAFALVYFLRSRLPAARFFYIA